jgi:hypothetical protein
VQEANAEPSRLQRNVEPDLVAVKLKLAAPLLVGFTGLEVM